MCYPHTCHLIAISVIRWNAVVLQCLFSSSLFPWLCDSLPTHRTTLYQDPTATTLGKDQRRQQQHNTHSTKMVPDMYTVATCMRMALIGSYNYNTCSIGESNCLGRIRGSLCGHALDFKSPHHSFSPSLPLPLFPHAYGPQCKRSITSSVPCLPACLLACTSSLWSPTLEDLGILPKKKSVEEGIPNKWKWEASLCSHFNIWQNDFKAKLIKRHREGHYILTKEKILQGDIAILNIYTPNSRVLTFIKEILPQLKLNMKLTEWWRVNSIPHFHQ